MYATQFAVGIVPPRTRFEPIYYLGASKTSYILAGTLMPCIVSYNDR